MRKNSLSTKTYIVDAMLVGKKMTLFYRINASLHPHICIRKRKILIKIKKNPTFEGLF